MPEVPPTFPAMTGSQTTLRRAIAAFVERRGMTRTGFGTAALGDPSFLAELGRGRSPRLDTADRVLAFMGIEPMGPAFRREVDAFLAVTGVKPSELGREASGNPSFMTWLRRGGSPRLATVDRVRAWMTAHAGAADARAIRDRAGMDGGRVPPGSGAGASSPIHRAGDTPMDDDASYLSTPAAAALLGLSPRTLDRYRVNGEGPQFHKFGRRVRYARADLLAWAAGRRRSSTSDAGSIRGAA